MNLIANGNAFVRDNPWDMLAFLRSEQPQEDPIAQKLAEIAAALHALNQKTSGWAPSPG